MPVLTEFLAPDASDNAQAKYSDLHVTFPL
jgi:hypothetical protein